jgi:hypothetical protein
MLSNAINQVLSPRLSLRPIALAGQALLFFLIKKGGKKIKAAEKWLQITAFA